MLKFSHNDHEQKIIKFSENPDLCKKIEDKYGIKVIPVPNPIGLITEDNNTQSQYVCKSTCIGEYDIEALHIYSGRDDIDIESELLCALVLTGFFGNTPNPLIGYELRCQKFLCESSLRVMVMVHLYHGVIVDTNPIEEDVPPSTEDTVMDDVVQVIQVSKLCEGDIVLFQPDVGRLPISRINEYVRPMVENLKSKLPKGINVLCIPRKSY